MKFAKVQKGCYDSVMARSKKLPEDSETTVALIAKDVEYIKKDVGDIKERLEKSYVTREEFDPIKKLVYGIVGLVLTGVVGALLTLIIRK